MRNLVDIFARALLRATALTQKTAWTLLLAAPLFASCIFEYYEGEEEDIAEQGYYLMLQLNSPYASQTRADDPNGGEEGDGREPGLDNVGGTTNFHENTINNATLFLFKNRFNKDAEDDVEIDLAYYFPETTFEKKTVDNKEYWEAKLKIDPKVYDFKTQHNKFYAVVVANAGDLTEEITTFGDLRDYHFEKIFTPGASVVDYKDFVMTSVTVSDQLTFNQLGTEDNPYLAGTITIQRLAARIDIQPNIHIYPSEGTLSESEKNCEWKEAETTILSGVSEKEKKFLQSAGYLFWVKEADGTTNSNDRFLLTEITLMNEHKGGTWLAKRTTSDRETQSDLEHFGIEQPENNGAATNYVMSYDDETDITWGPKVLQLQKLNHLAADFNYFVAGYTEENCNPEKVATLIFNGIYMKVSNENKIQYHELNYEYKIRHSDPDGKGVATDPMHFAIVRNNIYRIKVEKVVKTDLEHAAVVLYWKDSSGNYKYQSVGIDKDIIDDPDTNKDNKPVEPNDAPRRPQ